MQLTKDILLGMYRRMVIIRLFEESLQYYFEQGYVPGAGHSSVGEEAVAVGACSALGENDYLISTHRAHGHLLARGASLPIILAEVFGKATGCTGGKGGSMHLSDFDRYILGTNGIVGGGINIAGGIGLSLVMRKTDQVCLCFFGDGASNRGTFHEGLNLSARWKVPTVFLCTNNKYAMTTPVRKGCANIDISARAVAYDMPGFSVDGTDVLAVYEAVKGAVERARRGEGPSLIVAVAYRFREHSLRHDLLPEKVNWRPKGEVEEWWKTKDPIKIFRQKLKERGYMTDELVENIETECQQELDKAVDFAIKSPEPNPESIFMGIYAQEGDR